jgi:predicted MFS family arabinose efflux permease
LATLTLPIVVRYSTQTIGIFLCILLSIAFIAIIVSPREKHRAIPRPVTRRHGIRHIMRTVKKLNPASTMLLLSGLSASTFYGVVWFVVPLAIAQNIVNGPLEFGLAVFDLAIVALGFFLGRMVDKGNQRVLIAIGLALFAGAGVLISFNLNMLFLLLGFLATTGDELAGLSLWKWLHTLDKTHAEDGLISSVITFFSDIGWAIGPIVGGILYPLIGPEWTLFVGSLFLCVTVVTYFVLYRKKHVHIPGDVPHRVKRTHRIR